jgi:PEP-CTERM motif
MKTKINTIKLASFIAILTLPLATKAQQVVNLNDYDNFAASGSGQYNPYVGPGAYTGTTVNDFWNGFGLETSGNTPYPSSGLLSDSTGTPTTISYSINYSGNSGGLYLNPPLVQNGQPGFLLGEAANSGGSGSFGTLTLDNVAAGSYDLYLYGANYDGDRGAVFTVSNGTGGAPTAVGGYTQTINPNTSGGSGPLTTFTLGGDYVEFTGVTPDASGNIDITWTQGANDNSGGGEGDFNGMSLVAVPEPSALAFLGLGIAGLIVARRRKQQNVI